VQWVNLGVYSSRKAVTLIVEVANAGGAHIILVILTVSLVLSDWVKFATLIEYNGSKFIFFMLSIN
jgi:hypothetical protein